MIRLHLLNVLNNPFEFTPIDLPVLDLPNSFERPNGESASLKTDLKNSPGVLPSAQGVFEIRDIPKSW